MGLSCQAKAFGLTPLVFTASSCVLVQVLMAHQAAVLQAEGLGWVSWGSLSGRSLGNIPSLLTHL